MSDAVRIWLGNGSGGFGSPTDYGTGMYPSSVAVGDFNDDGKKDLAVADAGGNAVSMLLGNGSGGFGARTDFATGFYPWCVRIGDFNGDGNQDLATANHSSGTVSVFLGNGSGGFAGPTDYAAGLCLHLRRRGRHQPRRRPGPGGGEQRRRHGQRLLDDGSGGFDAKTDFPAGLGSRSVAIGDFNGDDVQDLATADAQANTVSVLLNMPWGTTTINGGDAATASRLVRIDSTAYGATQMRLRDQGDVSGRLAAFAPYTYWTLPSGDGPKTIQVQYRNGAARCPAQAATILLDTTPPTTADDAPAGWQSAAEVPLTVSLTAGDGSGSGVARTQYKVDAAKGWSSGDTIVLGADGMHSIRYRSVDDAGNVEEIQYASAKIDATAPIVSLQGVDDAWHAGPVMP